PRIRSASARPECAGSPAPRTGFPRSQGRGPRAGPRRQPAGCRRTRLAAGARPRRHQWRRTHRPGDFGKTPRAEPDQGIPGRPRGVSRPEWVVRDWRRPEQRERHRRCLAGANEEVTRTHSLKAGVLQALPSRAASWQHTPRLPLPLASNRVQSYDHRRRSIISRNTSPDIPFDQSVNAYRGCEHGCIYCYARPSHAYLDLSPGLDFETRLYAKTNAPEVLRKELSRPGYVPQHIAMGTNTDPYQPIERRLRITAALLEVFDEFNHPVSITTKSTLITRDIPLLARLARRNLVRVFISLGTLNRELARRMEPRAATPGARLEAVRALRQAGVPVGVLIAPVIPALNDHELERVAIAAAEAGAIDASYILLRLPREVAGLFQ